MAEKKLKISVVNYTNSIPFVYGLEHFSGKDIFDVQKDIPSICADKLINNKVDIGLVPVAILPLLKEYFVLTNYCIGADGEVASVMLYSDVPLNQIEHVLLDFHSRTSVQLVQVLAEKYWKISPSWMNAPENFIDNIGGTTAAVVIGDRSFALRDKYKYRYDLSSEWKKFTGLPFVFAVWVSNKKLNTEQLSAFTSAIEIGMQHIHELADELNKNNALEYDAVHYLSQNISYALDEKKLEAMELFLSYLKAEVFI